MHATRVEPTEREKLREAARGALSRRSLLSFAARSVDGFDPEVAHSRKLCEYLDALAAREIENLMVFMPPQHGKSLLTAQCFPAYMLGKSAGKALVATTSYSIAIARKNSRMARALIRDRSTWPFPDVTLSSDSQSVDEWYVSAGGGVKAAGVGGSLTGFWRDHYWGRRSGERDGRSRLARH